MTQLDMLKEQIEELKKEAEENREKFKKSFNENALETLAGLKASQPKWHKVADGDLPKKKGIFLYRDLHAKENRYVNYGVTNDKELLEYFDEWAEISTYEDKEVCE